MTKSEIRTGEAGTVDGLAAGAVVVCEVTTLDHESAPSEKHISYNILPSLTTNAKLTS